MNYEPRIYREDMRGARFRYFNIAVEETDLQIGVPVQEFTESICMAVFQKVSALRTDLKKYISVHPEFLTSHSPLAEDLTAPEIVRRMLQHTIHAYVGPMAAVAGAVAELIGEFLCSRFGLTEVIIENGGDIWLKVSEPVVVRIDAGSSPLSKQVGVEIQPMQTPCGICTSSGSTGHSFSYGLADAVTVMAPSAACADAWATSLCNLITKTNDLERVVSVAQHEAGIAGVAAIMQDTIAVCGTINIRKI